MRPYSIAIVLFFAVPALACSVCGVSVAGKNSLREEFLQAKAVVSGVLKNPKSNSDGLGGTTEFHFSSVLKNHACLGKSTALVLPKYFPVVGSTPPGYVLFFDESKGAPEMAFGVAGNEKVADYLFQASKLDPKDSTARLGFYFRYLESTESTIASDAFLEFAKAPDLEIARAKSAFDPDKLKKWLLDSKTPSERLGVYAALLGLCGKADHLAALLELAKSSDRERVGPNLGGVLVGITLLDSQKGWTATRSLLLDDKRPFEQRFAALGSLRFFQATYPKESRKEILAIASDLIGHADYADLMIEDLRRWGWWDKTPEVLGQFSKPVAESKAVKKAIVRYALTCPDDEAKRWVNELKKTDAKLVMQVEDGLKLLK